MTERRRSSVQLIARRMLLVIVFYFVCWTPYWINNLYRLFTIPPNRQTTQSTAANFDQFEEQSNFSIILATLSHFLVYANSALNPVFYGIFNLELRRQRDKQSIEQQNKRNRNNNRSMEQTDRHYMAHVNRQECEFMDLPDPAVSRNFLTVVYHQNAGQNPASEDSKNMTVSVL